MDLDQTNANINTKLFLSLIDTHVTDWAGNSVGNAEYHTLKHRFFSRNKNKQSWGKVGQD